MKQLPLMENPKARAYIKGIKAPLKKEFAEALNEWMASRRVNPYPYMLRPCEGIELAKMKAYPSKVAVLQAMAKSKYNMCLFRVIDGYMRASRLRYHDEVEVRETLNDIYEGKEHEREE